ncbi:MAG: hypothetical protein HFI19_08235 [Lachnospiraceae bacterium]|jgi:hypothetical protein|nr:hypothetical protein [Lachnospiraceae bacterium]
MQPAIKAPPHFQEKAQSRSLKKLPYPKTGTGKSCHFPKPAAKQKIIIMPGVLAKAEQGRMIIFCLAASPLSITESKTEERDYERERKKRKSRLIPAAI